MKLLRPLPARLTRVVSVLTLAAWAVVMGALVHRSYIRASAANLATDLARYGASAHWRGIYYRGEKIGFSVGQVVTLPAGAGAGAHGGFELQEDGRLQMALMGDDTFARVRTTARVDQTFGLQSFEFELDPGTGPTKVSGVLNGLQLSLTIASPSGVRTETRTLAEAPALALNLGRRLAASGLTPGATRVFQVFDPATLSNAPMTIRIGDRELLRQAALPIPAFRVDMSFAGLSATSWITETGEVVREESALGMLVVKEDAQTAQRLAVSSRTRTDLIEGAAIVPKMRHRIDDPRSVRRLVLELSGAQLPQDELTGAGQRATGNRLELRDPRELGAEPADAGASAFLQPEPLIESDAPEIVAEARKAAGGIVTPREKAERLVRYVNALLEKKPTVSIPSAREVLRTRIGDCNEHTALYVALARASGIPARIAVGLVYLRGAFYYHAWPEVYVPNGRHSTPQWIPVDPTLNQFPADATHLRVARGGLARQTVVLQLIGRLQIEVVDLELQEGAIPILQGAGPAIPPARQMPGIASPIAASGCGCGRHE